MSKQVEERHSARDFLFSYISPSIIDATIFGIYGVKNGYRVYAKPEIETACTYYDERTKEHVIFIGTDTSRYTNTDTKKSIFDLTRALLIHELGHTKFTHVDSKALNQYLSEAEIPFSLLNLAEDARIEDLIKKEIYKKSGLIYRFGWEQWFLAPEMNNATSPESVLFNLINTEGEDNGTAIVSARVREYYDRFLSAKDTYAVVDILVEWKNEFHLNPAKSKKEELAERMESLMQEIAEASETEFGQEKPDGEKDSKNEMNTEGKNQSNPQLRNFGDIGDLVDGEGNKRSLRQMLEGALSLNSPSVEETENPFPHQVNFETRTVSEATNNQNIFSENESPNPYYEDVLDEVVNAIKKISSKEKQNIPTNNPTSRFNSRNLYAVVTNPSTGNIYQSNINSKKKIKKDITIVLDLSGSMGGVPITNARTALLAMNLVAEKEKDLKIRVVGSKVVYGESIFQTIVLPANPMAILSANANGESEGIGYAIKKSKDVISKSDTVIFFTDGQIGDKEINKKIIGKYLNKNAKTIGMYVAEKDSLEYVSGDMKNWFDYLVVNESIVDSMVEIVKIINDNKTIKQKNNYIEEEQSSSIRPT